MRVDKFFPPVLPMPTENVGQLGVPGAEPYSAMRTLPTAKAFYVDTDHALANDGNTGTSPDEPLATIQGAVDKVENPGDIIYVMPGTYTESVTTPNSVTGPNYIHLVGVGPAPHAVTWASAAATSPCLIVKAMGWLVSGFKFTVPSTAAAVVLTNAATPYTASDIASRSVVENCVFDGGSTRTGAIGIDLHGSPSTVLIQDNMFTSICGSTQTAIAATVVTTAEPDKIRILNNTFVDGSGAKYIDAPLFRSVIQGNVFLDPLMAGHTKVDYFIDLRGKAGDTTCLTSGGNIVSGNVCDGTYTAAGGYVGNATHVDFWIGNLIDSTTTNGWSVAAPA